MNNHTCVSELEYEQYLKYCAFYGLGVQLPPQVPYNLIRRGHPLYTYNQQGYSLSTVVG